MCWHFFGFISSKLDVKCVPKPSLMKFLRRITDILLMLHKIATSDRVSAFFYVVIIVDSQYSPSSLQFTCL